MSEKTAALDTTPAVSGDTPPPTLEIESRSFEFVPTSARFGTIPDQRKFWFMVNATLVTVFTGTVGPAFGLGLGWTLVAIVLGSLAGTVFQALHAAQGPVMGLPQMIQSRVQFGSRGALIPLIAAVIALAGFPLFSVQTGAGALSTITPIGFGPSQVLVAVVAAVVAIFGFRLVLRVEKVLSYISVVSFVLLSIAALALVPWSTALAAGWAINPTGFLAQTGASAVLQLGIAPFVSDYTRYLPRRTNVRAISAAVFGGTLVSAIWISMLGAVVIAAAPHADPIATLRQLGDRTGLGIGTVAMVVAVPAAALSAATGLYSAAISLLTGVEAFRSFTTTRAIRTAVLSALGLLVVVAGLALPQDATTAFGSFLTILGYLLVPWTAVNLIDFYVVRREAYSISDIVRPDGGIYGRWSWRGLLAYGLGFVAMLPFVSTPFFAGPVASALGGADISFAVGLVVASATYLVAYRHFDRAAYTDLVRRAEISTMTD